MKVTLERLLAMSRARRRVIELLIIALAAGATITGAHSVGAHGVGATGAMRASAGAADGPLRFRVSLAPATGDAGLAGRLLIFMTQADKPREIIEPDFLNPSSVWIAAL